MASKEQLKTQKQIREEIERLEKVMQAHNKTTLSYKQAQEEILRLTKESFEVSSKELSLGKQIEQMEKSLFGIANKRLGLDKQISVFKKISKKGTKEELDSANKLSKLMTDVAAGNKDFSTALNEIATEDFGHLNEQAEKFGQLLQNGGEDLEKQVKTSAKLSGIFDNILESVTGINIEEALTAAGALAIIGKFASKTLEVKQSLGTSAVESARLAGNMSAAGVTAKLLGGNAQEAEAAVTSMVDEFGSLSVVSLETSVSLGKLVASSGLTGENAAKLLKSMDAISGASIETNIALIKSAESLARAEGVAPAKVLNDIASDTETFAKFGRDGGKNLIRAGIAAAKLGLSMSTVASAAENLLDFESSIEKQMEASVLLGRQLNLDKARELALTGKLDQLQGEILKQVGSEAEFNNMNVVQRKALADAIGVSVSDLGKMVAGEKTSAALAEEKQKAEVAHMDMQKAFMAFQTAALITQTGLQAGLARKSLATAVGSIFKTFAQYPFGLGIPLALAAVGSMYALSRKAPKMQTGGTVRESGMAVVHRGETVSGTAGQFGGESNKLLKELISQNASLMGKLTNKVGDLALSS